MSGLINASQVTLQVLVLITSILLIMTVLFHKGRGGGISDLFGGGMASSMQSSGSAERTLTKITVTVSVIWAVCIVLLALLMRLNVEA